MIKKKYQVFVSSTYKDLREERKEVEEILLSADCIPAGMEIFVATDDEQFEVIKRIIDLCDYYILIIGKKYGSINPKTGFSYTEMEYDYAVSKGIPVLVFAIDDSVNLESDKEETQEEKKEKLKTFRDKALKNRLAKIWKDTKDLTGSVALSINNAKQTLERPGWIRSDDFNILEYINDNNVLNKEKEQQNRKIIDLTNQIQKLNDEITSLKENNKDLAFDNYSLKIHYRYKKERKYDYKDVTSVKTVSLKDLFAAISICISGFKVTDDAIENYITGFIDEHKFVELVDWHIVDKIINQFMGLNLMRREWLEKEKKYYYSLTLKGETVKNDLNYFKK